jgi:hypothetical protein
MTQSVPKTVYILFVHGASTHYFDDPNSANGIWIEYLLKKALVDEGYNVKFTTDGANLTDFAALISFETSPTILKNIAPHPREKCILLVFEPPHVAPDFYSKATRERFGKILIFYDTPVDNQNYFRFYMPFMEKSLVKPKNIPAFSEKKFCVAIQGNKFFHPHPDELYTERRKIFSYFMSTGDFEIYGPGWKGAPCWKGMAPDPLSETFKKYKFSIIYENFANHKGYITERLFAGMASGSVPAYKGASDITDYVPADCFIDVRNFSSFQDLYRFMKNMNEETYNKYLNAIDNYFSNKNNLKLFTKENYIQTLMSHVPKLGQ